MGVDGLQCGWGGRMNPYVGSLLTSPRMCLQKGNWCIRKKSVHACRPLDSRQLLVVYWAMCGRSSDVRRLVGPLSSSSPVLGVFGLAPWYVDDAVGGLFFVNDVSFWALVGGCLPAPYGIAPDSSTVASGAAGWTTAAGMVSAFSSFGDPLSLSSSIFILLAMFSWRSNHKYITCTGVFRLHCAHAPIRKKRGNCKQLTSPRCRHLANLTKLSSEEDWTRATVNTYTYRHRIYVTFGRVSLFFLTLKERAAHTQRDSPGGSMRRD